MFQRLLVAIDETERTDVTLSFATSIARHCGSTVHLLFVNEYQVGSRGIPIHSDEEATDLMIDAMDQLRAEGIVTSGSVRRAFYRHVADCITASASEISADTIILGSRRRRRLDRLFSTRVRERTIRLTPLPVLTAPAPLELATHARFDIRVAMRIGRERERTLSE